MVRLMDNFGRRLNYIRLSLTDRCNYRCVYCMPDEGVEWIPHENILSYEEIIFLAGVLRSLGIEKIRFTGGEPLVRRGFFRFLKNLGYEVPDVRTVLTTNGSLIVQSFEELASSSLSGINVSLDTLNKDLFRSITRKGSLEDVLSGISLLSKDGRIPVKINTVLMKGINDMEVPELLAFAHASKAQLRLIEFMPLDNSVWKGGLFLPASNILEKLPDRNNWERLDNSEDHSAGPAKYFRNRISGQKLGIIEAVSHHFCDKCNRLRITATGVVRPCLFSKEGLDLRPALKSRDVERTRSLILEAAVRKPESFRMFETGKIRMSSVGG